MGAIRLNTGCGKIERAFMLKWIFKKQVLEGVKAKVENNRAALKQVIPILLKEDNDDLQHYGDAVSTVISETSAKFSITEQQAIYGGGLTWQQLNVGEDDFNAACIHALNMKHGISATAHAFGQCYGLATQLMAINYGLKFNQKEFPQMLPKEISDLLNFTTKIINKLYDLGNYDIHPDEFYEWLLEAK